jgi:hypothetical protein
MARHSGSGFAVAADPNFVAGAAVGHAIGEGVRTRQREAGGQGGASGDASTWRCSAIPGG